jgi:hypothetical protein
MSGGVTGACDEPEGEVSGPLWLVDLAIRLARGELVVYVEPGRDWEMALRMLAGRDVQTFVVAPGNALQGSDVSIFGLPV